MSSDRTETASTEAVPWSQRVRGILVPLLLLGLAIGLAAALLQIGLLRFGEIARDQMLPFLAFFLGCGAVLATGSGALARSLFASLGTRRRLLIGIGAGVPVLFFAVFVPLNVRGMPNVFLLVTDATRADHLSVNGYERDTTPFLREMSDECVVFRNMLSQGSHTIVTTPCILASCYPSEHGMVDYHNVLSPHFTLISEYLQDKGYKTYGYATNPHLGRHNGFVQGFDVYEHDPGWAHTPAEMVNERLLKWIDGEEGRPVFGYLFYIDPHNPYVSPPSFQRLFDPEWPGEPITDWYQGPNNKPDPRTLFHLLAQYDGTIAYWDQELRDLVDSLRARKVFQNALLLYTADHGEEFWEHGNWGHNRTLFEESIHIPLVISFPLPIRFPPLKRTSRYVDGVASSVDIVPTILDYLRMKPDPNVRGRSLLPIAFGRRDRGPERQAYLEQILTRYGPYDLRGLRSERFKYVMTFNYEGNRNVEDAFYDLLDDPGETRNGIRDLPDEAESHRQMLAALVKEISSHAPDRVDTVEVDETTRERLRALGYIRD
ncbi:MAG: sulfatase [Candidatus Eisenbacteria bacterium]